MCAGRPSCWVLFEPCDLPGKPICWRNAPAGVSFRIWLSSLPLPAIQTFPSASMVMPCSTFGHCTSGPCGPQPRRYLPLASNSITGGADLQQRCVTGRFSFAFHSSGSRLEGRCTIQTWLSLGFTAIPATCPMTSCTPPSSGSGWGQLGSALNVGGPEAQPATNWMASTARTMRTLMLFPPLAGDYRHDACIDGAMRKFLSLLVCGMAALSFGAAAANNEDDGFVWIDANTKIKLIKPVSAAAGETKAPQPQPEEKKPEKRKK